METARIGAYGGTFDPIHRGHVEVATAVLGKFRLDELLIIPAASPPHKDARALSGSHHRFAMAAITTLPIAKVRVSSIEIDSPGERYTFETIGRLRARYGRAVELYFIVGSDSFEEMHTWRRPDLILAQCNLVVAARPGYGIFNETLARLGIPPAGPERAESPGNGLSTAYQCQPPRVVDVTGGRDDELAKTGQPRCGLIFLTDYIRADISSTEIRRRIAQGLDIEELVPPGVAKYIHKYGLYKAGPPAETQ